MTLFRFFDPQNDALLFETSSKNDALDFILDPFSSNDPLILEKIENGSSEITKIDPSLLASSPSPSLN